MFTNVFHVFHVRIHVFCVLKGNATSTFLFSGYANTTGRLAVVAATYSKSAEFMFHDPIIHEVIKKQPRKDDLMIHEIN